MSRQQTFLKTVCNLAIPVALQSMFQASFSIVDQIMIGQLGTVNVAGVGLAGKFASIYSVVVTAIGTVAGIMLSQYIGQKNKNEVHRSFRMNMIFAFVLAGLFTVISMLFSKQVMGLYSKDVETIHAAAIYLVIYAGTFFPVAGSTLLSTVFRCIEKAKYPLYASIAAAILNTGLNYILIFGKCGFAPMGIVGAAIATLISQIVNFAVILILYLRYKKQLDKGLEEQERQPFNWVQYGGILLPILICEFVWSLGENVYAVIYGHLGTEACAAMTLTNPIQGLLIGALCGLSQAAGILIGKKLGEQEYEEAYADSKKLIVYGFIGSVLLSAVVLLARSVYVQIYQVEETVKILTEKILVAYAAIAPFKVANMILGGGIIRSGGKTNYVMAIDMIGTWVFGVPMGLVAAFWLEVPIYWVYFILSLEECIRFLISLVVFKKKVWMQSLR